MPAIPAAWRVSNSTDWEIPSWLLSRHSCSCPNTESSPLIHPSSLPPSAAESNPASATNPFRSGFGGCDEKLPNSSRPLSIWPFRFRSSTSHAAALSLAVQDTRSLRPSPSISNATPSEADVSRTPSGLPRDTTIGVARVHNPSNQIYSGFSEHSYSSQDIVPGTFEFSG